MERKLNRLQNFDYATSVGYFITICTQDKKCLLSQIVGTGLCSVQHLPIGKCLETEMQNLENKYNLKFEKYVIMPNHIHMIVRLCKSLRTEQSPVPTISDIICELKSKVTKLANKEEGIVGRKIFQRSFYDRIIRDDEYQPIAQYILENPYNWQKDEYYKGEKNA
ncbi:MAG: transposase [Alphaproteobacteria bacterium]